MRSINVNSQVLLSSQLCRCSICIFQDLKILNTSRTGGGGLSVVGPESEISVSLKNLKPEKIGF